MRKYQRMIFVLIFLAMIFLLAELTGLREHFTLLFIREKLSDNLFTGMLIFTALFSIGNFLHIPGLVFLAAAVLGLGEFSGGIATYIAATVSCTCSFLLINFLGKDAFRQIDNRTANRLLDHLHANPIRNIVLLRTLFQTLPALNYALALSGVSFRKYMLGTLLGLPLPIALYCLFFAQVARYFHLG
jgi:uncharacterized membrane protein YdjX (TVP38/TMEM64 family)